MPYPEILACLIEICRKKPIWTPYNCQETTYYLVRHMRGTASELGLTHHDSVNELLNHYFTLFDFIFLFDLWFQEFQIKAKTRVFFFHFSIVYTKICFGCQDGKAAPLSAGKFGSCEERWDFVHTVEYAMAF